MAQRIQIGQLANAVMRELTEYKDLVETDMKAAVKKAGNTVRTEIKATAPKRTGTYGKSWTAKTTSETANTLEITVHSRNRYQIAHLLEHGHAKRGGGRVAARPHIAAAEEKGVRELEQEIQKALEG